MRCAHSGWYLQFSCNHSCRPVSRRGVRSASTLRRHVCILQAVTGWTTSSRPDLITPTLLIHQLLRSEREGDWLFQQLCIRRLLPYFFIAGHHTYARYLSWHCLEMAILLPAMAKDDLLSGAFVCRHKAGSWNAVSVDQFGEQTAIKIGKGGLKGITLPRNKWRNGSTHFPYQHTYQMHSTIDTLQIKQTALARRHTKNNVSRDAMLILMTVDASARNSINVLIPWRSRAMFCITS